jgi:hypothetical protein
VRHRPVIAHSLGPYAAFVDNGWRVVDNGWRDDQKAVTTHADGAA